MQEVVDGVNDVLFYHCERMEFCGSWRRGAERIGDIDVVVAGLDPGFDLLGGLRRRFKSADLVLDGQGPRVCYEVSVGTRRVKVDIWQTSHRKFGAMTLHATGPARLNFAMRRWASLNGLRLRPSGLFKGDELIASETEEECFEKLGWPWIPPEERSEFHPAIDIFLAEMNKIESDVKVVKDTYSYEHATTDGSVLEEQSGVPSVADHKPV